MKVICINNKNLGSLLTKDKWYDVYQNHKDIMINDQDIIIIGDRGMPTKVDRKLFKTLEELRDDYINSIIK